MTLIGMTSLDRQEIKSMYFSQYQVLQLLDSVCYFNTFNTV